MYVKHLTRWLIPLPAILFAVFPQTANAEDLPICPPENLTVFENGTNILLDWVAPSCGLNEPERYAIFFTSGDNAGWAVATGNVGDATALDTDYRFTKSFFEGFGFPSGSVWLFTVRSDNDTLALYSDRSNEVSIVVDYQTATTTTTTTELSTTTTTSSSTTTLPIESSTTSEQVQTSTTSQTTSTSTSPATTTTTTAALYPTPQTSTTAPEPEPTTTTTTSETTTNTTSLPEPTTTETTEETYVETTFVEVVADTLPSEPSDSTLANETETTLPLPQDDDSEASNAIVEPVFKPDTDETPENSGNGLLTEIVGASPEKIVAIVETILATSISQEQAIELVSSPEVLAAISEEQAEQIFEQITPEQLSEAEAEAIIEAVQNAPNKVKKAFQNVINIFGSQFESYVPLGSNIPVSQRRTLVAIGGLLTMLPMPTTRIKQ